MHWRLLSAVLCHLLAIFLFAAGFFPQKTILKGDAVFGIEPIAQKASSPVFDRLVLVVIDALRSDFLFSKEKSQFSFVHSLLESGEAWGFTAFSNPPTVTLPRLKGITTGSTPNFLDAILNVAEGDSSSNIKDQDSWPRQMRLQNKTIRFFGDDTWLKLFPLEMYDSYEGTNSFFVSDFEQVDNNVTRHIPKQMAELDKWDILILHYLGLDHIGHKGGAQSKFMPAKQQEMDNIIKDIYTQLDDKSLLVVMGDHGMNDAGNHGGSTPGETSAGMAFLSKKLKRYPKPKAQRNVPIPIPADNSSSKGLVPESNYQLLTEIQQVDLVPTLAALFNFPIPKNSIGVIIPHVCSLLESDMISIKLQENYRQLLEISAKELRLTKEDFQKDSLAERIQEMMAIQENLSRSATNYDYRFITAGLVLECCCTIFAILLVPNKDYSSSWFLLTIIVSLIIGISTFASSFVEEEHQIWWWIVMLLILTYTFKTLIQTKTFLRICLISVCARLIYGWNNSGQKYTYDTMIADMLRFRYQEWQWYLNTLTIIVLGLHGNTNDFVSFMESFLLTTLVLLYKVSWSIVNAEKVPEFLFQIVHKMYGMLMQNYHDNTSKILNVALIPLAQLFFYSLMMILVLEIIRARWQKNGRLFLQNAIKYLVLLLIFQSPPCNIGLYLLFHIMKHSLFGILSSEYEFNPSLTSILLVILQNFTFFQFGCTNSIATVDLTNAYNGVSQDYNIYWVGFLMCVSNFAPSIYWSISTWDITYGENSSKWQAFIKAKIPILVFNCIVGTFLLTACLFLRYHLFIWTVFSPKLCYFLAWNIFMHGIIGYFLEIIVLTTI